MNSSFNYFDSLINDNEIVFVYNVFCWIVLLLDLLMALLLVFIQVVESVEEPAMQYLHIAEAEDPQGTETAVSALQDLRFNTQNGQNVQLKKQLNTLSTP